MLFLALSFSFLSLKQFLGGSEPEEGRQITIILPILSLLSRPLPYLVLENQDEEVFRDLPLHLLASASADH